MASEIGQLTASPGVIDSLQRGPHRRNSLLAFVRKYPFGALCGLVLVLVILIALFAPALAPYPPNLNHLVHKLQSPDHTFLLGTDDLGRDTLSRVIYGARISMTVGLISTSVSLVISLLLGVTSAYFGGAWDYIVGRIVEVVQSLPSIILLLALVAIAGRSIVSIGIVLGFTSGIISTRVMRATALTVQYQAFVDVARSVGCTPSRLMLRHIVPNLFPIVIVLATINVGVAIIAEAGLSFLGYGVAPPTPSWGGMISVQGRSFMILAPWLFYAPIAALMIVIFALNMLGDALRDHLDPRLRNT
jgi:peptide/nickel transport system permease protein